MAQQKETTFKKRIRPLLKALPNTWFVKTQQRSLRGTPDFLMCVAGKFVALELKRSAKEKPDPLQDHNLKLIRDAGGVGLVVFPENWNEVFDQLKIIAGGKNGDS